MTAGSAPVAEAAEAPAQQGAAAQKERRFVYSGRPGGGQSEYMMRGNKPLKRRRKSPFKIVSLIAVISVFIVFYVWNKIVVNRLAQEIDALEAKKRVIESVNQGHRADIGRKSSRDLIEKVAMQRLKMIYAPEQQIFFEVENYQPAGRDGER